MEYRPISDRRPLQRALHHPNPFTGRSLKDRVLFRSRSSMLTGRCQHADNCTVVDARPPAGIRRKVRSAPSRPEKAYVNQTLGGRKRNSKKRIRKS